MDDVPMAGDGLSRYQVPNDDQADPNNRLFRIELKQIGMEKNIDKILLRLEDRDKEDKDRAETKAKEEKAERFSHKDMVNVALASIASIGALMGGVFWIIQTQINPFVLSFETEKHSITDRFMVISETIRQIRELDAKRSDDIMKFMEEQHKEVIQLQLRMQKEEDRK